MTEEVFPKEEASKHQKHAPRAKKKERGSAVKFGGMDASTMTVFYGWSCFYSCMSVLITSGTRWG